MVSKLVSAARSAAPLFVVLVAVAVPAAAAAAEITGAAILDHPCGKVAVQNMELVHAGKMAEAVKLGTKAMQEQWAQMPKEDREMMSGMMKEMSVSGDEFRASIKAGGTLTVDGDKATLVVKEENKDANGSSTSTMTQRYEISGSTCLVSK